MKYYNETQKQIKKMLQVVRPGENRHENGLQNMCDFFVILSLKKKL